MRSEPSPLPVEEAPPVSPETMLDFRAGFWRLADPKITLASMASLFLGTCFAAKDGPLSWSGGSRSRSRASSSSRSPRTRSGEIFDFDSGTDLAVTDEDRSPFSGGKRVLVDGLLTRRQTWAIAGVAYALGAACGLAIVVFRERDVIWLGLAGVALAYFYHAPPLRLSYRGLGEFAVALAYGPLIAMGTYLVQREKVERAGRVGSIPLGLIIVAFLWTCEFPDYLADRDAGKRNLVVRLGRGPCQQSVRRVGRGSSLSALLLPLFGVPWTVTLGAVSVIPASIAARRILINPEFTLQIIPAQALTLVAFLVLPLGSGAGVLLGR